MLHHIAGFPACPMQASAPRVWDEARTRTAGGALLSAKWSDDAAALRVRLSAVMHEVATTHQEDEEAFMRDATRCGGSRAGWGQKVAYGRVGRSWCRREG